MTTRYLQPFEQVSDNNGKPISGAKLTFYTSGTSSLKNTYSDAGLTVANSNPVVCDSAGRVGDIFLALGDYKVVVQDASGVTIRTVDPVPGDSSSATGAGSGAGRNLLANPDFRIARMVLGTGAPNTRAIDGWFSMAQTTGITVAQQTNSENGQATNLRLTQPAASAQRIGALAWVPSLSSRYLRGSSVVFSGRIRSSLAQAIRYAILEWTGTADQVLPTVVNDWTSSSYTAGGFFTASSVVVTAVGSITPSANVWTDLTAITGTLSGSANNAMVMLWTEGTLAQNATLDLGKLQLEAGSTASVFERRPLGFERQMTMDPDPSVLDLNRLVNGAFEFWQASTSLSISASTTATASIYAADQWCMETSANQACTISRQTSFGSYSLYCARVQRNSGQTGTTALRFQQPIETPELVRMRGQYITVAFQARKGADFAGTLVVKFLTGTGTEGRRTNAASYTGETAVISETLTLQTTGQGFMCTSAVVVPTNATQAALVFEWTPSGTAGTNDYFDVAEVDLRVGFWAGGLPVRSSKDEFQRCQRFFWKITRGFNLSFNASAGAQGFYSQIWFPVTMRATPTVGTSTSGGVNVSATNVQNITAEGAEVVGTSNAAGVCGFVYSANNTVDARL